jgi:hypothetical protein
MRYYPIPAPEFPLVGLSVPSSLIQDILTQKAVPFTTTTPRNINKRRENRSSSGILADLI